MKQDALVRALCPPLDPVLVEQMVTEFASQTARFSLGDWEPATLDAGQFCEALARIVYAVDCGTPNRRKPIDQCLQYVEDPTGTNLHRFPDRRACLHLTRILRLVYKFRSDRGAVHIDPAYTANEVDARFVIEAVRWVMVEILRLFWNSDRTEVSRLVRELARHEVPVISDLDGRFLVQRTDVSVDEEIMLLLRHVGAAGMSRRELGEAIPRFSARISEALKRLVRSDARRVSKLKNGNYILTPLGSRDVLHSITREALIPG